MTFKTKPAPQKKPKAKAKPSAKNSPMLRKLAAMAAQQSAGGGLPPNPGAQTLYRPNWPTATPQPPTL